MCDFKFDHFTSISGVGDFFTYGDFEAKQFECETRNSAALVPDLELLLEPLRGIMGQEQSAEPREVTPGKLFHAE